MAEPQVKHANYVVIFVVLAALTAVEIAVSQLVLPPVLRPAVLLGLAVGKAALVVLYYMHLRYDSRLFAVIFLIPVMFFIGFVAALLFS
jgi:cytochrome c oxidase subunit 4